MENNIKNKAIYVSKENHKKLMHLKFEHNFKNLDETVSFVLSKQLKMKNEK